MAGAQFTGLETGVIVAATSAVNFALTSTAFESGVAIGSAINAANHERLPRRVWRPVIRSSFRAHVYRYEGAKLLTRERFLVLQLLFGIYSALWAALGVYVFSISHAALWLKVLVGALLIVGTPSVEDLFERYGSYKRRGQRSASARFAIRRLSPVIGADPHASSTRARTSTMAHRARSQSIASGVWRRSP